MGWGKCFSVNSHSKISATALTELKIINTLEFEARKASNIIFVNSVLTC